jgi:NADP-dependent aldehyde dehydrogenase
VKAHPAHLGTSELVGKAVQQAVAACGLHEGVFSMLIGGVQTGADLVAHPAIKAVGFTGSRGGGLALVRIAQARKEPIPVYAEMASINPVFLLPGALKAGAARIAQGFADSLTMGSGQFCTNPGLLVGLEGPELDEFAAAAAAAVQAKPSTTMLTPGIHQSYAAGVGKLSALDKVDLLAQGGAGSTACAAQPHLYSTDAGTFLSTPALEEENFGPSSVLVRCRDAADLRRIAEHLEGQLTATVHATAEDRDIAAGLLPTLERKAGRILFNGFPTGVEVAHAMVHGGPFPATSDPRSTSVGATAIDRFLRPVSYQDAPEWALPPELSNGNPHKLPRVVDGKIQPGA